MMIREKRIGERPVKKAFNVIYSWGANFTLTCRLCQCVITFTCQTYPAAPKLTLLRNVGRVASLRSAGVWSVLFADAGGQQARRPPSARALIRPLSPGA